MSFDVVIRTKLVIFPLFNVCIVLVVTLIFFNNIYIFIDVIVVLNYCLYEHNLILMYGKNEIAIIFLDRETSTNKTSYAISH